MSDLIVEVIQELPSDKVELLKSPEVWELYCDVIYDAIEFLSPVKAVAFLMKLLDSVDIYDVESEDLFWSY